MALESASFINGLDANNPAGGDSLSQADDHIRLIKAAIKATFPNVTGVVTSTHTTLSNPLPGTSGVTTAMLADLGVTSAKIADAAVATAKLADGSVTTPKIADTAVTLAKLNSDVTTAYALKTYADALVAAGRNGNGVRTVSTSAPSGGANGDVWYQVI
jgi:hypothetical protein